MHGQVTFVVFTIESLKLVRVNMFRYINVSEVANILYFDIKCSGEENTPYTDIPVKSEKI